MYVSDYLDSLIDAGEIRNLIRTRCLAMTEQLPDELARAIRPVARYLGGKCMGYPPVWFIREILDLSLAEVDRLLESSRTALCISLSTSIADDLLDGEHNLGGEHLMLFYLLILEALAKADWHQDELGKTIHSLAVATMHLFVNRDPYSELSERGRLAAIAADTGLRIGNFHRMVAYDILRHLQLTSERRASLVELVGRFGEWCAQLDDVLDVEQDILDGELATHPVLWLLESAPELEQALAKRDLVSLAPWLRSQRMSVALAEHLADTLNGIAGDVAQWSAPRFADKLHRLAAGLATEIPKVRDQVHQSALAELWREAQHAHP